MSTAETFFHILTSFCSVGYKVMINISSLDLRDQFDDARNIIFTEAIKINLNEVSYCSPWISGVRGASSSPHSLIQWHPTPAKAW